MQKKIFEPPCIKRLGKVAELTLTSGLNKNSDVPEGQPGADGYQS